MVPDFNVTNMSWTTISWPFPSKAKVTFKRGSIGTPSPPKTKQQQEEGSGVSANHQASGHPTINLFRNIYIYIHISIYRTRKWQPPIRRSSLTLQPLLLQLVLLPAALLLLVLLLHRILVVRHKVLGKYLKFCRSSDNWCSIMMIMRRASACLGVYQQLVPGRLRGAVRSNCLYRCCSTVYIYNIHIYI